jgi:hypothetical protein
MENQPPPDPSAPAIPLPSPTPPEFVINDVPCRKCSYNLRTLPIAGTCPECGAPVGVSVYGDLLRYSDPGWVRKLATGTRLILINIFVVIGLMMIGMIFAVLRVIAPHSGGLLLIELVSFAANFVGFVGAWLLTERDPSGIGEDQYGTVRKVIRITLLFGVASAFITIAFNITVLPPAGSQLLGVINGLLQIVGIVGVYAQIQYLEKLALRLPDQRLSERANTLKVWLCGSYGAFLIIGVIENVSIMARGRAGAAMGPMMVVGCVAALLGIPLLVLGIMYILMIDRFRAAFNQQAVMAEQIWGMQRGQTL